MFRHCRGNSGARESFRLLTRYPIVTPRTSIIVLADDLTGAAEIAAAGFSHGLDSIVATGTTRGRVAGELVVHDTDTRLLQPADAARKIVSVGARCHVAEAMQREILIFKKTDSVLRGPVVAELDTLTAISRHARVLLVAGNPRLERVIRDGCFYVGGEPIHQTVFGRDPHHPARSPLVTDLLGPPRRGEIHFAKPGDDLPASGIIVGEASSLDDVRHWARRIEPDILPAGSSVFFEAVLDARGFERTPARTDVERADGILLVSGTMAGTTRNALAQSSANPVPMFSLPEACALASGPEATATANRWTAEILGALAQRGRAVALAPAEALSDAAAPARIRAAFAGMIAELHKLHAFQHLIVEGGATAAMIVHMLHWNVLNVAGEPAPGVATLTPRNDDAFRITLKPGSYPWPTGWLDVLGQSRPASSWSVS